MQKSKQQMRCPRLWEEWLGIPTELVVEQGVVCVTMGENILVLPREMKEVLSPFIGRRIGLIRTDQEYIIRTLSDEREATQDALAVNPIALHSNNVECEVV